MMPRPPIAPPCTAPARMRVAPVLLRIAFAPDERLSIQLEGAPGLRPGTEAVAFVTGAAVVGVENGVGLGGAPAGAAGVEPGTVGAVGVVPGTVGAIDCVASGASDDPGVAPLMMPCVPTEPGAASAAGATPSPKRLGVVPPGSPPAPASKAPVVGAASPASAAVPATSAAVLPAALAVPPAKASAAPVAAASAAVPPAALAAPPAKASAAPAVPAASAATAASPKAPAANPPVK
jgi:hypothetical protein